MSSAAPTEVSRMSTDGRWVDVEAVADVELKYRTLTGWEQLDPPVGLWIVLARLAFTREGPLPPGGVLLSISCDGTPPPRGMQAAQCSVDVDLRRTGSGKQILAVRCALRDSAAPDHPRARVSFELLWPDSPEEARHE